MITQTGTAVDCNKVAHTGSPSCVFNPKEIVGLLITYGSKRYTAAELSTFLVTMKADVYASGVERIYPIHNISNLEASGGDVVTSKGGYGGVKVVKYDTYSEKYRVDKTGMWFFREVIKFIGGNYRAILLDREGNAILTKVGDDYAGIALSDIAPSHNRANGTDPSLNYVTIYYTDLESAMRDVEAVKVGDSQTVADELQGLIGVSLVASAGKKVNVVDSDSAADYGLVFGSALAVVGAWVGDATITSVTYSSVDNSYTFVGTSLTKVRLASASALQALNITSIEGVETMTTLIA